jgi:hypothetical protein
MCTATSTRVSKLPANWGQDGPDVREARIPSVHGKLRFDARRYDQRKLTNYSLQSAALIHETYLRSVYDNLPLWQNHDQLFDVVPQLMRHPNFACNRKTRLVYGARLASLGDEEG